MFFVEKVKLKKKIVSSFVDARILFTDCSEERASKRRPVAGKEEGSADSVLFTEFSIPPEAFSFFATGTGRFNPPLPFIVSGGWGGKKMLRIYSTG